MESDTEPDKGIIIMQTCQLEKLVSKLDDFLLDSLQFGPISAAGVIRRVEIMDILQAIKSKMGNCSLKQASILSKNGLKSSRDRGSCTKESMCYRQNINLNLTKSANAWTKPVEPPSTNAHVSTHVVFSRTARGDNSSSNVDTEFDTSCEEDSDVDDCSVVSCMSDGSTLNAEETGPDCFHSPPTQRMSDTDAGACSYMCSGEPGWPDGISSCSSGSDSEEEPWPQIVEQSVPRRRQSTFISLIDSMRTIPEERLSVISLSIASEIDDTEYDSTEEKPRLMEMRSTLASTAQRCSTDDDVCQNTITSACDSGAVTPVIITPDLEDSGRNDHSDEITMDWDSPFIMRKLLHIKDIHFKVEEIRTLEMTTNKGWGSSEAGEPTRCHAPEESQRITYCNPLEPKFVHNFVVLPRTRKAYTARLMTYSPSLRKAFAKMGSMKTNASNAALVDIVCQSGLVNPDCRGWLRDLDSGVQKWCVVADMLLCMFTGQHDEKPVKTLLLPGHEIKGIVYNSAKRGAFPESSYGIREHLAREHKSTISGQHRYQFVIENLSTQEEHAFGVDSQDELDLWISILKVATNLDTDVFDSSAESDRDSGDSAGSGRSTRSRTIQHTASCVPGGKDSRLRRTSTPRSAAIDDSDIRSSTAGERVNIKLSPHNREQTVMVVCDPSPTGRDPLKVAPLPAPASAPVPAPGAHQPLISKYQPTPRSQPGRLEKNLSRSSSSDREEASRQTGPVFARVIRCNSCRELRHNVSLSPSGQDTPTCNNKEKKSKALKRQSSFDNLKALLRRKLSDKEPKEANSIQIARRNSETLQSNKEAVVGNQLSQSLPSSLCSSLQHGRLNGTVDDSELHVGLRTGIGTRLAQKANSLKDRVFGTRSKVEGGGNARLGSLTDIVHSGFLLHKHLLKWLRVWCVVSNGYMYAYRSCFPVETPIISVLLKECSLSAIDSEKTKKAYSFKLCQLNARGLYFAEEDSAHYTRWIQMLTRETSTYESFQHGMNPSSLESIDSITNCDNQEDPNKARSPTSLDMQRTSRKALMKVPLRIIIPGTAKKSRPADMSRFAPAPTSSSSLSPGRPPSAVHSPCKSDGLESGFSSMNESQLLSSSKLGSTCSSRSMFSETYISDTDSDYPESTFDDDMTTPDSLMSSLPSSLASSLSSPLSSTIFNLPDSAVSSRLDTSKANAPRLHNPATEHGTQLSLLRSQVMALPNKPLQQAFNKYMGRLENGSSATDRASKDEIGNGTTSSNHKTAERRLQELRRMSLSDGHLHVPVVERLRAFTDGRRMTRAPVPQNLAARDISNPTAAGYLDKKQDSSTWDNIWCVLKDGTLYIYSSPIDESAIDSIPLFGYEVKQLSVGGDGEERKMTLELSHEEYKSQLYRTPNAEALHTWTTAIKNSSQKLSIEGLALEDRGSSEFNNTQDVVEGVAMASERQWEQELLLLKKQQLLDEVLRQKSQLETQMKIQTDSSDSSIDNEKLIKEVVQLKQRKTSVNIKMDGVQRTLNIYQNQRKKKRFRLPGAKSAKSVSEKPCFEEEFLEKSLLELSQEMSIIEKDLEIKVENSRLVAGRPDRDTNSVKLLASSYIGSNQKERTKDRKNKYSGALKFLNPTTLGSSNNDFRRRANTFSFGNNSDNSCPRGGSLESLQKKELGGSNETLQLLKNLNLVSIENAALRHSWESNLSSQKEDSMERSQCQKDEHRALNGYRLSRSQNTSPGSSSQSIYSICDPSIPKHQDAVDLNMMSTPREDEPTTPDLKDKKAEISSEALAHIAEFEELLRVNNVQLS